MKKGYLTLLVLLSLAAPIVAQEYAFESLTVEDGLSQSSVISLAQDNKGFLWIGTRDGLNRYDGKEVTIFRKTPFDTNALQSNIINCLLVDHQYGVYVGTSQGLQRYDQITGRFATIHLNPDRDPVDLHSLYFDQNNHLWAATANGFFMIMRDENNGQFLVKAFFHNVHQGEQSDLAVHSIFHSENGDFWVSSSRGIIRSTTSEDGVPLFPSDSSEFIKTPATILGFQQNKSGEIIGYGVGGVYLYESSQNSFLPITTGTSIDLTTRLEKVDQNMFWSNSTDGIIFHTWRGSRDVSALEIALPTIGLSQSRHHINFVLKDKIYDDFYWLATDLGGVLKMYKRGNKFHTTLLKDLPNLEVTNPYLRHIVTTGDNVWLNMGAGIILFQRSKDQFQFIDSFFSPDQTISTTSISSLFRSESGKVYASIKGETIELYLDQNDQLQIRKYSFDPNNTAEVNTMVETKNHFIRGGRNNQISTIQKRTFQEVGRIAPMLPDHAKGRLEITCLLFDKQSNLWIGSSSGLFIYPNFIPGYDRTQEPLVLQYNPEDTTGLIENRITALLEDSKGVVWISTRNGLMSAKMTDRIVDLARVQNAELKNKVLYGILEDKKSYQFWLSSNNGLYRFDPGTQHVDHFDFHDGLQGNEFNSYSYHQSAAGEMFFGGTKGFTSFFPEQIIIDTTLPPIWITSLTTTENQHYNLLASDTLSPLRLGFAQRSFSIKFIGLNYLGTTDLEYYYNLKGTATLTGIPLAKSQQVNFSQLDPGNYTLEIYSENKNGYRNAKSDVLHFIIETPFWRMPWFFVLITLCIAFLGWLLFYLRYQAKIKQLKAVEQVRRNISEDFHDELGSKLSIISMYSEFSKQELSKENSKASVYLDKVNDTASRLYENTRDLIWALNPQHDSLYDLFLQLKDFGEEMFQDTNIDFHSAGLSESWKNRNLPMRYKRHLLLIFKEAMHNALKHSGCKTIKLSINEKDQKLIIMVQDDGVGFDASAEHKGDGLKNMVHRAAQLKGGLHFISKKEGTRIWVELPFHVLKQMS